MRSSKGFTGKKLENVSIQSVTGKNTPDMNSSGSIEKLTIAGAASAFGMIEVIARPKCGERGRPDDERDEQSRAGCSVGTSTP